MSEELIKRLLEDADAFERDGWERFPARLREAAETLSRYATLTDALSRPAPASAPVPDGYALVSREVLDKFPELNMSNYGHDDVDELNAWGIELVQSELAAPAARESGAQEAAFLDAMTYGQGFLLRSADGTETHIPVENVMQPVAQGGGVDAEKVMALVEEYFDVGVREGREGRDHDDEAGTAQRLHSQIRALLASPAGKGCTCEACVPRNDLGSPTMMSVCPECGDKRCQMAKHHGNACSAIANQKGKP